MSDDELARWSERLGEEAFPIDEPHFQNPDHLALYRQLVERIEAEVSVLPGMQTLMSLLIRKIVRDWIVGLAVDQGNPTARAFERDSRMLSSLRMLLEQASRADLEHALRTEFVIGLITEVMRVLDAEVDDKTLRVRLKELLSAAFVAYTDSVQGRISR